MSLRGAQLVCLTGNDNSENKIKADGKTFKFGYYTTSNYILQNTEAKGIHCEISADAFNRVTILNYCKKNPIIVNGFPVKNQRPLFHGNIIKIFEKEFIWQFPKKVLNKHITVTPAKQQIYESSKQPPSLSEPRKTRKNHPITNRLSIHSFAYCIAKEEVATKNYESDSENSSLRTIESSDIKENISVDTVRKSNNISIIKSIPELPKNKTESLLHICNLDCVATIKSTVNDTTLINCNTLTYKGENKTPQAKLGLCKTSDVLVTSYSPKTIYKNLAQNSFAIIKSNKITSGNVDGKPRSVLSEQNKETIKDIEKSMNLFTPQIPEANSHHSSMHLIDLTVPAIIQKTAKQIVSSPLMKCALKKSTHRRTINSYKTKQKQLVPVLEASYSPLNSSKETKYGVIASSAKNINQSCKNILVNLKPQIVNPSSKVITPVKPSLTRNDISKILNLNNRNTPLSDLSGGVIDSSIQFEDIHNDESIMEVTDDSIYSCKSIKTTHAKETPKKRKPDEETYAHRLQKTHLSNLSSHLQVMSPPLSRSLIPSKMSPRSGRLSFRSRSPSLIISPLKKPAFTSQRTNMGHSQSLSSLNFKLASSTKKTYQTHSYEKIMSANSTPVKMQDIYKKNTFIEKTQTNLMKNNIEATISNIVDHTEEQKLGTDSELNNTFTITSEAKNLLQDNETIFEFQDNTKNTTSNENVFLDITKLLQSHKHKENINNLQEEPSSKIPRIVSSQNENDLTNIFVENEVSKTHIKELLNTPKKEITIKLVGEQTLSTTAKNDDKVIDTIGLTELYDTPLKESDQLEFENFAAKRKFLQGKITIEDQILENQNKLKILSNQTEFDFELDKEGQQMEFSFENFQDEPNFTELKAKTPQGRKAKVNCNRKTLGNENSESSFDLKTAKEKREKEFVFENFNDCPKFSKIKAKTPEFRKSKMKHNRMTMGNDTESTSFDLEAAKNKREMELAFENFKDEPNFIELKAKTPEGRKTNVKRNRKTLGNENSKSSFDLKAAKEEREEDLLFENFNDFPKFSKIKAKTPEFRKSKMKNNRKTMGNDTESTSFDLEAAKNKREMELAFENFKDEPNFIELKAKTPESRKTNVKNNRKTLGNEKSQTSFDLKAAKEERENELVFENFNDFPKFSQIKAKTPEFRKSKMKNNRKTMGNDTESTSFDLEAAKNKREMELAFENFKDEPNFIELKAKTPESRKTNVKRNRKTLGNENSQTSFDLKVAKEEREKELVFENFNDCPKFAKIKAKTPEFRKSKMKNNRKTMGNDTESTSFDLEAAKNKREMELAFENFKDEPNFIELKAKTPESRKTNVKNNRKTLGNEKSQTSFDLKAAKEERENELVFENFNDFPKFSKIKAKTTEFRKSKMKNNRKTMGNDTESTSFDLEAAKNKREMELAFENFKDEPNFIELKAKTPESRKTNVKNNRKTLGNEKSQTSFDLKAAKEERENELVFENFNDFPKFSKIKAKTPEFRKSKMKNNRKTMGNDTESTSFDLEAAKNKREMELAFENFKDEPNFIELKAKTPESRKTNVKRNRKTLGNENSQTSFDLKVAKEEREKELVFENFNDCPKFAEIKAKTPEFRKSKMKNNRKTMGNDTESTSFDLEAAKNKREMELAFENFKDEPNFIELKAKTPESRKTNVKRNRKTLGNENSETSFDLKSAKEEREKQLVFENFIDCPMFSKIQAKTPEFRKSKMKHNRKTMGNDTESTSFDLEAAKNKREMELAFENFKDEPNFIELKAKTPEGRKTNVKRNRKTLGNENSETSCDLKSAKEERENELVFENFIDCPMFSKIKAKTPEFRKSKMKHNRITMGNDTENISFDLEAAKNKREMELAFENFKDEPNFIELKGKTLEGTKTKVKSNRKTLGNENSESCFDLKSATGKREKELVFEKFNDCPKFSKIKHKTPEFRKSKMKDNRITMGNNIESTSFVLETTITDKETKLSLENFNDLPDYSEVKNKTPEYRQPKTEYVGNQTSNISCVFQKYDSSLERSIPVERNSVLRKATAKKKLQTEVKMVESMSIEIRSRTRKQLNNNNIIVEQMQDEQHFTEEVIPLNFSQKLLEKKNTTKNKKETIEITAVKTRSRSNKELQNVDAMEMKKTKMEEQKLVELPHADGLDETNKLINIGEIILQNKNGSEGNIIFIENTRNKSRGRPRKQLNKIIEVQVKKQTEAEKIIVESTTPKTRRRITKPAIKLSETLLEYVDHEETELKTNESIQKTIRGKVRNQLHDIVKEIQVQKEPEVGKKMIESTKPKTHGRTKKPASNMSETLLEYKDPEEAELKLNDTIPVKSRGRPRNQVHAIVEEIQKNKKKVRERKIVTKLIDGCKTKKNTKKTGENSQKKKKSTSSLSKCVKKKNEIDYTDTENIEQLRTQQIPIKRTTRRNLEVITYFGKETSNNPEQKVNSIIDININNSSEERGNVQKKVQNRRNKQKYDVNRIQSNFSSIYENNETDKIKQTNIRAEPKRELRSNSLTPIIHESKNKVRKTVNDNDSTLFEVVQSTGPITRGRVHLENNEDESGYVKVNKTIRSKRKRE